MAGKATEPMGVGEIKKCPETKSMDEINATIQAVLN